MSRKNKVRRSASEVLNTFTRENVTGWLKEREQLAEEARGLEAFVAKLRSYHLSEEDIAEARAKMSSGNMMRLSYIESNVRRAAMALTRAAGYKHWKNIIETNIDAFPSADKKATLENTPF
jgi:hypothetical protein